MEFFHAADKGFPRQVERGNASIAIAKATKLLPRHSYRFKAGRYA